MLVPDPIAILLAMGVVTAVTVLTLLQFGRTHSVVAPAFAAFALHAVRSIQVTLMGGEVDGVTYDQFGVALARYWTDQGADPGSWLGKDGFPALLGAIYTAVGHAPEIGYLINAAAGGLAVLVVAATTARMGWVEAVKPSAWLVGLWPVGFIYGGMLLREAIVTLILAIGLWGTVRLYQLSIGPGILAIAASGIAMIFMRGGLAFLVLVGMPVTAAIVANVRSKMNPARWILAISAVGISLIVLALLNAYFASGRYFEYRAEVSADQNNGSSSFSQAGLAASSGDFSVLGHALRVPITAIGPFPWQVRNPSLAQAFVDAALWMIVWAFAIYATVRMSQRVEAILFVAPTAALIVALAANSANFGLIIRLRGQAIVLIAPLAALGYAYWMERRRRRKAARADLRAARPAIQRVATVLRAGP